MGGGRGDTTDISHHAGVRYTHTTASPRAHYAQTTPVGTWEDETWPDGWTSVTKDGKRSAQFEHTLLVTADGVEVLTARTAESVPFWWEVEAAKAPAAPAQDTTEFKADA